MFSSASHVSRDGALGHQTHQSQTGLGTGGLSEERGPAGPELSVSGLPDWVYNAENDFQAAETSFFRLKINAGCDPSPFHRRRPP